MTKAQKDVLTILMFANVQAEFTAFRDEVNNFLLKDTSETKRIEFEKRYNQKVKNLQEAIVANIKKRYPADFKDIEDAMGDISLN